MEGFWNWINSLSINFKGLSFLGLSAVVTNAIGGIFWFYMASLLGAENYGEVSYYIGISMLVASITLIGAPNPDLGLYITSFGKYPSKAFFNTHFP